MTFHMPDQLTVEVYNADYRALSTVPWQEAIRLLLRKAAYIVDVRHPAVHIHSPSVTVELPMSVALREYIHIPYRPRHDTRVTREEILRRDRNTCVYCGRRADTIDHVLPRCRGGGDTWFNLAAACQECNGRKDDRTPTEAGMVMLWEPFEPKARDRFRNAPALA